MHRTFNRSHQILLEVTGGITEVSTKAIPVDAGAVLIEECLECGPLVWKEARSGEVKQRTDCSSYNNGLDEYVVWEEGKHWRLLVIMVFATSCK